MENLQHGEYLDVKFVTRALITNQNGAILIVKRPNGTWCLAGGKMEAEEFDPIKSLWREIQEETGLTIIDAMLLKTIEFEVDTTLWHNAYFVVSNWQGNLVLQEDEIVAYEWINPLQISDYIFSFGHKEIISDYFDTIES